MNFLEITPYVFGESGLTWYSIFVLSGALLTLIISNFLYKKDPESKKCPDLVFNTFLIGFPMGLVGARLWFVLSELEWYMANPIEILMVWEGGLAIQGGVILGAICGIWYAMHSMRKHGMKLKITTLMDMIIPNILIAQVCGRWGNFFNREVYGACVDQVYALKNWWMLPNWLVENMKGGFSGGIYVSCPVNQYAQPLFLYEGLLNFVGFILLTVVLRKYFKKRIDGTLSAGYLIWYGTVRLCLEGFRNEKFIMRWGLVSQSEVTSIAYIVLGVLFVASLYVIQYFSNKKIELGLDKLTTTTYIGEKVLSEDKKVENTIEEVKAEEKEEVVSEEISKKTTTATKAKKTTSKKVKKDE